MAKFKPGTEHLMYKHGGTGTRLYEIFRSMHKRCELKTHEAYHRYGGRGIKVCDEWSDFATFKNWALSHGYSNELSIDRIDPNGNYNPSNCRWATPKEQSNNRCDNHYVTYKGVTYTITQLSELFGMQKSTLRFRIVHGWSVEDAVERPVKVYRRSKNGSY